MSENNIIEATCKYLAGLFDTIRALEQNLKITGEIIQAINLQEVSRLLGMKDGTEIPPNIVPYLQKMRQELDALKVAHEEALKVIENREQLQEHWDEKKLSETPNPHTHPRLFHPNPGDEDGRTATQSHPKEIPTESDLEDHGADGQ